MAGGPPIINLNSIECRVYTDYHKMKAMESWPDTISGVPVTARRKKCPCCGAMYKTAEFPPELAQGVFSEGE